MNLWFRLILMLLRRPWRKPVDGLATIQCLRERFGKQIPAIILSGDTSAAVTDAAREAGIPLLHKPVRPARLRALLQRKTQV